MAVLAFFRHQVVLTRTQLSLRLSGAAIAAFSLICAALPAAEAAGFTCSWNDATADWTTVADWSNCNSTFPNNGSGNTFDATISQGNPTLTTTITIGSVTTTSPGAWSLVGPGTATLTGGLTNSGALNLDTGIDEGGSSLAIGGTLNNSTTINVGTPSFSLATGNSTVSAAALGQVGTINLNGSNGFQAALNISAGPVTITSTDNVDLHDNGLFSIASGNLTNSGKLNLDTNVNDGGSSLTVGGTLTNNTTLNLGNFNLSANTIATAAGLTNNGTVNLVSSGGASAQLVLGTGITSIASGTEINLNGPRFFIALSGSPNSNSGLGGLTSNAGDLELHDAPAVVTNPGVNFTNSGALNLDTGIDEGGSSLAIGGTLNNSTTINVGTTSFSLATGNSTVSAAALGQVGTINLDGNNGFQAALKSATGPVTITSTDDVELHENGFFSIASGNLTNSGKLNLDTGVNEGGSNLTVGGTLTNNTTLNLGNSNLSANTTATAGGLTNNGTVNLVGNTGNAAIQATVTVNRQASNSGTVNLPTATSLTVTGTGNAYTQTAGFTNLSGSALAAPNVNITGGKMQGMGTVTGATNISGTGTIEAINLTDNSLPAALAINGNYGQSGGTFDALLHGTGVQIDEVNVTSGHSVNLTGGDLEVSGVTFTAGQVFDDIMTFQPGELTGTFATILGGGNGMSVNLGNGLMLDAIYDNAGGDISLAVEPAVVPAPLIGGGVPAFLAVSGMLFGAKLLERSKKRRSLVSTPHA